ncbi:hypothetical protein KM043_011622 [Ampulex compressa]|nr:hypothetical protein KM043_011622 [Ampulex compressa]
MTKDREKGKMPRGLLPNVRNPIFPKMYRAKSTSSTERFPKKDARFTISGIEIKCSDRQNIDSSRIAASSIAIQKYQGHDLRKWSDPLSISTIEHEDDILRSDKHAAGAEDWPVDGSGRLRSVRNLRNAKLVSAGERRGSGKNGAEGKEGKKRGSLRLYASEPRARASLARAIRSRARGPRRPRENAWNTTFARQLRSPVSRVLQQRIRSQSKIRRSAVCILRLRRPPWIDLSFFHAQNSAETGHKNLRSRDHGIKATEEHEPLSPEEFEAKLPATTRFTNRTVARPKQEHRRLQVKTTRELTREPDLYPFRRTKYSGKPISRTTRPANDKVHRRTSKETIAKIVSPEQPTFPRPSSTYHGVYPVSLLTIQSVINPLRYAPPYVTPEP